MTAFAFYFPGPFGGDVVATAAGDVPVGRVYVTVGGERLDQVAQAAYGFQLGAVEALLIANPGIADLGIELPASIAILLPELTQTSASREVPLFSGDAPGQVQQSASSTAVPRKYTTKGGERLDQVAQEAYGFQLGAVEALLIVNPGLADQGIELPAGVVISLPVLVTRAPALGSTATVSREAALWG